jgi:Holliday junction resolvase RusA-like endonuclease
VRIKFTVLGPPQGKARPKTVRLKNGASHTYTPDATVIYENLIAMEYRRQAGDVRFPDGEYIDLRVMAHYAIPTSTSKKRHKLMLEGKVRPTTKPDWDNIGKVVADSLNKIAYQDDAHIVDGQVRKFYSEQPRLEIILQSAKS